LTKKILNALRVVELAIQIFFKCIAAYTTHNVKIWKNALRVLQPAM